ncbi:MULTISPECIES: FAD-binding oxidoreductase [unclassified Streptococcus]|uniref:NAD(P)/FAD-dependent oxidoreductase n=1 Tax=unclassified Streptococcus TaxID=2608887 RepID=UPI00107244CC|nr:MULTISPECIES: FAD-binding oxidoreductase [unclassified Streptococcus]MBF0786320.1 FAD-binding oxidoreductase [Streptococcus sp. 19428wC2_LYSM12]MCQ9212429.1 FAD-binding oxidoreductase [Streptococcus sp. B01]MCQ9213767.1 FAD-binding oxidoreductase [Streptococcus sp. O1]TFV06731.1 FAD-binding oxidoreductase [Streptococcus sp. LYSM12]
MKQKKIIIIGGGIVGSTAAFYLSQTPNMQITLIDDGTGNATRAAAGIICPWLSQRRNQTWYHLVDKGAAFYLDLMQDLQKAGITHLPYKQTGTLVFKKKDSLLNQLATLAQERQKHSPMIAQIDILKGQELSTQIPPLVTDQGAVLTHGGGRVDGGQLLDQLLGLFQQQGGHFIQGKAQLLPDNQVQIDEIIYDYDELILAAGAWLPDLLTPLGYKVDIRPQKGQLLSIDTHFTTDNWPGCMLHGEIDILAFEQGKLVIGATHENDQGYNLSLDREKIQQMKEVASAVIPDLQQYEISHTRVGTRAYTSDFLPFYGRLSEHPAILVASGLGSSGLTCGPFIGWQLAQSILKQPHEFDANPYSPDPYIKIQGRLKSE